jgi:uncharacterized protein (DUF2147 family)
MFVRGTQLVCACLLVLGCALALPAHADGGADKNIYGYWKSLDKETGKTQSIFRIWEDKGKLVGKVVKSFPKPNGDKPQELCTECSGNQKDKPVIGLIFLWGLELDKENPRKWVDGKVLNPEDGKVYNAELELGQDAKTLTIYGYIKMLVKLGGSNTWQRPTPDEMKGVPGA